MSASSQGHNAIFWIENNRRITQNKGNDSSYKVVFMNMGDNRMVGEGMKRQKVWRMRMVRTDKPFPDVKTCVVT